MLFRGKNSNGSAPIVNDDEIIRAEGVVKSYNTGTEKLTVLKGIDVLPLALSPGVRPSQPAYPAAPDAVLTLLPRPEPQAERAEAQRDTEPTPSPISEPPHG